MSIPRSVVVPRNRSQHIPRCTTSRSLIDCAPTFFIQVEIEMKTFYSSPDFHLMFGFIRVVGAVTGQGCPEFSGQCGEERLKKFSREATKKVLTGNKKALC